MACLISGLEYFHARDILHRDIKPENLVIDSDGKFDETDTLNSEKVNVVWKLYVQKLIRHIDTNSSYTDIHKRRIITGLSRFLNI